MLVSGSADTGGGGGAGGSKGAAPRGLPQLTFSSPAPASTSNRSYVQPTSRTSTVADKPTVNLAGWDVLHQKPSDVTGWNMEDTKGVFSSIGSAIHGAFSSDVEKPSEPEQNFQMASPGQSALSPLKTWETQGISNPKKKESKTKTIEEMVEDASHWWGGGTGGSGRFRPRTTPGSNAEAFAGMTHDEAVASSQEKLDEAERETYRKAMGRRDDVGKVTPLTQAEYDAMSEDEKKAVDFNTMLVSTTRRDKRLMDRYDPSTKERNEYEEAAAKLFGEENIPQRFAPETVALLSQIDFHDTEARLADFLGLRAAITAEDINRMTPAPGSALSEGTAAEPVEVRAEMVTNLAEGTGAMQEALAKGNDMLATMQSTAALQRAGMVEDYGGFARDILPTLGYGAGEPGSDTQELDSWFQDAFAQLTVDNLTMPVQTILEGYRQELIGSNLGPEKGAQAYDRLIAYFKERAENSQTYGGDLISRVDQAKVNEGRAATEAEPATFIDAAEFLSRLENPYTAPKHPRLTPANRTETAPSGASEQGQPAQNPGAGSY